jgi:hypothetical protein
MRHIIAAALIAGIAAPAHAEWQINRAQDRMSDFAEYQATLAVPDGSMTVFCSVGRKYLSVSFGVRSVYGRHGVRPTNHTTPRAVSSG